MNTPKEIVNLSEALNSMPGIGPKMSNRLAMYLSVSGKKQAINLANSLLEVTSKIKACKECGNVTTSEICEVCSDDNRKKDIFFVVEDALDLYSIEMTREFAGLYHVLNGVISPINGVGPSDINLDSLFQRIKDLKPKEIILGLNPNVEGDSTSMYIKNQIQKIDSGIKITRLAKGIPVGSDLEFVSQQTIVDSLKSRAEFD